MPTYEYACASCQHEWEFEQSIKDAPLTECPACHHSTAKRQISRGTGFILKGGGWYSDLYSSTSNKTPSSSGDSTASESKPSTEKSSTEATSSSAAKSDTSVAAA